MIEMKKPIRAWLMRGGSTAFRIKSLDCFTSELKRWVMMFMIERDKSLTDELLSIASLRSLESVAGVRSMMSPAASKVGVAKSTLTSAVNFANLSGIATLMVDGGGSDGSGVDPGSEGLVTLSVGVLVQLWMLCVE